MPLLVAAGLLLAGCTATPIPLPFAELGAAEDAGVTDAWPNQRDVPTPDCGSIEDAAADLPAADGAPLDGACLECPAVDGGDGGLDLEAGLLPDGPTPDVQAEE